MSSDGPSGRASGGQLEERVDLSKETDEKIAQARSLIETSQSNLREALALLAALEKRCRIGNDSPSLVSVCEASLQLCKDCSDEEALISTLKNLATRRSQKTKAVSALVEKAIPWVLKGKGFEPLDVSNEEQKAIREKLVVALRDITDGKIFLERERARLTRALAIIKEQDGDIPGASDVLQEVHVETYGSLSKREKIEFILEQMRLTLGKKDYVRTAIVSGKINRKAIAEEGMEQEKIQYFTLMTEYHKHERNSYELAKDYHQIYQTSTVQANEEKWREALQCTVVFLSLSPYSMEQQDMLNRINIDPNLEKIIACKDTVKLFLKKEFIKYPMPYQSELESLSVFHADGEVLMAHWKKTFRTRIIQHNVRVASLYYRRIHGKRLAQLLGLSPDELEREIANMVSNGDVYAKIDRPCDIIRFAQKKTPEAVLSDWASDVSSLLNLVESTTHLINKENMMSQ
uniref:PCI domain-containing protein n=1 Tax=Eucampia antarctica TaxID=49252 RepID=A0A7S2S703_9STRA|mmetsp:Transcript_3933/g.3695  ORF Transcript_3933/g.3695 Transcript_3933/m.3695 type:complete len:461 (+) Transcript_3933:77-1459(+)|eukprot:CAMPEP_0197829250 /NCGR_PEP_ID=MMETSP1437-20131217/5674_1 /TAXON_ID=49252 ORGANISM="Eucampia antarctica, Strain CCMP1452" /NCGR_SAMPLE_ID=MMETSP1437 /ASSEMBLY_ACC=CAM_ASM_001096 /LENGTH=460 /DNA_ID=CAMNT_0043430797 /DNA_START=72 /DNA_END=1454 /DNA_ORIENTATION=+